MEVVYRRCCGLDIHKDSVMACVLVIGEDGRRDVRKKEFGTMLADLYRLRLWLYSSKVQQVAMESTGVYWKPIWNVLDGHFSLLLANPYHMRNIPGRKTDCSDARMDYCGLALCRIAKFRSCAISLGIGCNSRPNTPGCITASQRFWRMRI